MCFSQMIILGVLDGRMWFLVNFDLPSHFCLPEDGDKYALKCFKGWSNSLVVSIEKICDSGV